MGHILVNTVGIRIPSMFGIQKVKRYSFLMWSELYLVLEWSIAFGCQKIQFYNVIWILNNFVQFIGFLQPLCPVPIWNPNFMFSIQMFILTWTEIWILNGKTILLLILGYCLVFIYPL